MVEAQSGPSRGEERDRFTAGETITLRHWLDGGVNIDKELRAGRLMPSTASGHGSAGPTPVIWTRYPDKVLLGVTQY